MKPFAASFLCLTLAATLSPGLAQAGHSPNASELSAAGGLSVVYGSFLIVASPVILIGDVLEASTTSNRVAVRVKTREGRQETIELPKEAVAKADLQRGDQLTVKPSGAGAVLAKNDTPIAFIVPPENAKLSHSHELAR